MTIEEAMDMLGVDVAFLRFSDEDSDPEEITEALKEYKGHKIYAPALGANPQHNLISDISKEIFKNVTYYCTYSKDDLHQKGNVEVIPTKEEKKLKDKILKCYKSQLEINPHHFDAVKGKSEYQD